MTSSRIKHYLKNVQLIRASVRRIRALMFPGSTSYWENRYAQGGNSGDGSYGVLAQHKAEVLNGLVVTHGIESILEFGCGDGSQLNLAKYPQYVGFDISPTVLKRCIMKFADDNTKCFFLYDHTCFTDPLSVFQADMALSLDVIYHLVEDEIFEAHMKHLFGASRKLVAIYSSDFDGPTQAVHVRHRHFSTWIEQNFRDWSCMEVIKNPYLVTNAKTGTFAEFKIFQRVSP